MIATQKQIDQLTDKFYEWLDKDYTWNYELDGLKEYELIQTAFDKFIEILKKGLINEK